MTSIQTDIVRWVDLHIHSCKSDGTLNPLELIRLAKAKDLSVISITDHDTIEGSREALDMAINYDIGLVSGIEISSAYPGGTLHILGYGIDVNNPDLLYRLQKLKQIRRERNREIIEKLKQHDISIDSDDIDKYISNNESQGRPHIARVLLDKKIVESIDQAFEIYLGKGGKAYVPKKLLAAEEAIDLIHTSGGKAIIAHPVTLNLNQDEFSAYMDQLICSGIDGLEVYAPLHNKKQTCFFTHIAETKKLLKTAGSDFHGSNKPGVILGNCHLGKKVSVTSVSNEITTGSQSTHYHEATSEGDWDE